jgi:hypothetical protein
MQQAADDMDAFAKELGDLGPLSADVTKRTAMMHAGFAKARTVTRGVAAETARLSKEYGRMHVASKRVIGALQALAAIGGAFATSKAVAFIVEMTKLGATTAEQKKILSEASEEWEAYKQRIANTISRAILPFIEANTRANEVIREQNTILRDGETVFMTRGRVLERETEFLQKRAAEEERAIERGRREVQWSQAKQQEDFYRAQAIEQITAAEEQYTQAVNEAIAANAAYAAAIEERAGATRSLVGVTIEQNMGWTDAQGAGESIIATLEAMGASQSMLLETQLALNQESGLWTQSLLDQTQARFDLASAVAGGLIADEEALQLQTDLQNEQMTGVEVQDAVTDAADRTRLGYEAMGLQVPKAFDPVQSAAETATTKTEEVRASAEKVTSEFGRTTLAVRGLERQLRALRGVSVSVRLSMPSQMAGGGDFITTRPTMIMVGDNPGRRERVSVTPLSGRGRTTVNPQSGLIRAAGGLGMGGSGGTTLVLQIDGRTISQRVLEDFQQAGVIEIPVELQ